MQFCFYLVPKVKVSIIFNHLKLLVELSFYSSNFSEKVTNDSYTKVWRVVTIYIGGILFQILYVRTWKMTTIENIIDHINLLLAIL